MKMYSGIFAVIGVCIPSSILGAVTYTFEEASPFDNGAGGSLGIVGSSEAKLDATSSINVTLTTTEIVGQDGSLATGGADNTTNVTASAAALGVNSDNNLGGYSNESRDFNPGEEWSFSFDVPVILEEMDFAGWGTGALAELASSAFPDMTDLTGSGGTIDLGGTLLPANTEVTLRLDADSTDTGVRLTYLTVTAVPEPSGVLLLGVGSMCLLGRRGRAS